MLRALRSRLAFWRDAAEESDETAEADGDADDGGDGGGGFRRSRLDASVLYAHGADVERLDREIAEIEARSRELEEARRED